MSTLPAWYLGTTSAVTAVAYAADSPGPEWQLWPGPGLPVVATAPTYTLRADIFRRATADETAAIAAQMEAANDQAAQLFGAIMQLDHVDPMWPQWQGIITAAVGDARAAVLLAPSG